MGIAAVACEFLELGEVHLVVDGGPVFEAPTAVADDGGLGVGDFLNCSEETLGDDTGFGYVNLVKQDEGIDVICEGPDGIGELVLDSPWAGVPVLAVEAIELARWPFGLHHQGLAVGKSALFLGLEEVFHLHARELLKRAAEFVAFAIAAAETNGPEFANVEGDKVI